MVEKDSRKLHPKEVEEISKDLFEVRNFWNNLLGFYSLSY